MPGNETLFGTPGTDRIYQPGRKFVEGDILFCGKARIGQSFRSFCMNSRADSNVKPLFASKDRKAVVNLLFCNMFKPLSF